MSRQPPSMGSIRLPSCTSDLLSRSGADNVSIAVRQSSTGTRAMLASPGIEAHTRPRRSAIANIAIHTNRVLSGSHQTVDAVMLLNSLVNVTDIRESLWIMIVYTLPQPRLTCNSDDYCPARTIILPMCRWPSVFIIRDVDY